MSNMGDEFESLSNTMPKEQRDKLPSVKSLHNNGWTKCSDQEPPSFEILLVVKQYQDAPTEPMIDIDFHYKERWSNRGRVTHWMEIPKMPNE